MIQIGYGKADFRELITRGFYYVDRTRFLEVLESMGAEYLIFLRPRRFGKSLWISLLQYYYGLQYKNEFEQLFGNTYIGKKPTNSKNNYYILRFNFSGLSTETDELLTEAFVKSVRKGVRRFFQDYPDFHHLERQQEILNERQAAIMVGNLLSTDSNNQKKVYLLIDEYDHFANELIAFRMDSFRNIVSKNGWVRKFYETLKIAANEGVIEKMFITGVSPIMLDSMTSGFNIASNRTLTPSLHNMMGFTEDEVRDLLRGIEISETQLPELLEVLKSWYNGYRFSKRGKDLIYNADMVLYFVEEYKQYQEAPEKMLSTNIASDYNKIKQLFSIGGHEQEKWDFVDKLLKGEKIEVEITDIFSFERNFTTTDFLSLLFYMGFLTIDSVSFDTSVYLKMPNRVIANLYQDYFIQIMNEIGGLDTDISTLRNALNALVRDNNPYRILAILCETLKALTHRDFQKMDEKHIQTMFFCYVNLLQVYDTKSEYQTEKQYYDIVMLRNGLANELVINEFLFEFKYLKKGTPKQVERSEAEAKAQIEGYLQHKQIQRHPNLHAWQIVIVGDELEVCKEIFYNQNVVKNE
jgi:hypothetical protein